MNTLDWRYEMANAVIDPAELLQLLKLPLSLLPAAQAAAKHFGLRVPRQFIDLMVPGDLSDPLLRQILPINEELLDIPGFSDDPVGDQIAIKTPGMLIKYPGRALIIASPACAIHCRYCLRRNFPYKDQNLSQQHWQLILENLRQNSEIHEVILSGGDPLTLNDEQLNKLVIELAAIPHLQRLRIHTRLPILIPSRITQQLLDLLHNTRLIIVIVVHVNHPRELAESTQQALKNLCNVVTLLNQSVLLHRVNDNSEVLIELSASLFETRVLPYYIHLLDRVRGTAHFEVTPSIAKSLIDSMRQRLPGYLVPRLVQEEPGAAAKTLIA